MKLKRVKILGFKTFADKTEFELDGDIVAVVGPNGCGKSNIVDAILWGLGETSSKAIRAQTGKEVIFAGSVHRKGLGLAEVTLHFDNEDGALPLDTPEVSVTRRVDRSGQGDYEINRRACRLKDVSDLLADSGLGRAGYAIVGQSEIDQALAASPQQRRAWIDEAAGVHRYRMRRQEAVRRLDAARVHLDRVHDVMRELENQRGPLAEEAEVAMRYKSALKSLRQVECGLLVKELADVVGEVEALEAVVISARQAAEKESALVESLEVNSRDNSALAAKLEAESEELRTALSEAQALVEQTVSALEIAKTRLASLTEIESNLGAEADAAQQRVAHAEEDLAQARLEAAEAAESFERLEADLVGVDGDARELAAQLEAVELELEQARALLAKAQRAELELAHRERRAADVREEIDGIDATNPDLVRGVADAEAAAAAAADALERARSALKSHDESVLALRKSQESLAAESRELMAELAALDGRRRGIEATIEAHEGLAQGPRAVLSLVKSGQLPDKYVPVGDCVDVDPDLALAVDTALGAAANDLIVPDDSWAKKAIELLKAGNLGRATFQPVNLMRHGTSGRDLHALTKRPGVIGVAAELVQCDPSHRPVVDSLLGRVLVVEDLDVALGLARTPGWSKCVTLDGELVHASGAVTGGRAMRQTMGLVQRQAELNEAVKRTKETQSKLKKIQATLGQAEEKLRELARLEADARATVEPLVLEHEEAKSWLNSLRQELAAAERSKQRLVAELEALESAGGDTVEAIDIRAIEQRRDTVWKEFSAKSTDSENAQERIEQARLRLEGAQRRVQECERRLANAQEADKHRESRAEGLEPERQRLEEYLRTGQVDLETHRANASTLSVSLESLLEQRRTAHEAARTAIEGAQQARHAVTEAESRAHQAEIKRARLEGKRAATLERLLEEYGVDEPQALADAPSTVVPPDAPALVTRLRRELKEMGEVNLGAVEAYERLTERFEELSGQSQDIEAGMSEIETSVAELDRLTKERFNETFDKVKVAFAETFRRLFNGGEGVIETVQAEDELDAGVEIEVTVPGKKRQRLQLLSGGERAMSAIAFLFALLKVKPSPLVILDEVDAPLDGRNVERFISLLRDFCEGTQFILVTHNSTTISSADVWFGVTMQEPGVSTLVPFKMPEHARTKANVPDVYLKG